MGNMGRYRRAPMQTKKATITTPHTSNARVGKMRANGWNAPFFGVPQPQIATKWRLDTKGRAVARWESDWRALRVLVRLDWTQTDTQVLK